MQKLEDSLAMMAVYASISKPHVAGRIRNINERAEKRYTVDESMKQLHSHARSLTVNSPDKCLIGH